jgi:hypothetical protein
MSILLQLSCVETATTLNFRNKMPIDLTDLVALIMDSYVREGGINWGNVTRQEYGKRNQK